MERIVGVRGIEHLAVVHGVRATYNKAEGPKSVLKKEMKRLGRKIDGRTGGSRSSSRRDGCTGVSYDGVFMSRLSPGSSRLSKPCGGSSVRSLDGYVWRGLLNSLVDTESELDVLDSSRLCVLTCFSVSFFFFCSLSYHVGSRCRL